MIKLKIEENRIRISEAAEKAGISPERFALLLKSGSVSLSGKVKRRDSFANADDKLEIDGIYPDIEIKKLVIYEDENFFVMRKPSGMDCLTKKETGRTTLYSLAVEYMQESGEYNTRAMSVPYICQSIDKGSAGLVMIAKNEEMFALLMQAVRERRLKRIMSAYIGAVPQIEEGELSAYASGSMEDEFIKISEEPRRGYIPVITRYRVIDSNMGVSYIEATNLNGGVSVMRAQLAAAGMPVIGDGEYGDEAINERFTPEYPAMAVERFVFETGVNNRLAYLNARIIESDEDELPELKMRRGKQGK